jgi:hypothetical protein
MAVTNYYSVNSEILEEKRLAAAGWTTSPMP